MFAALPSFAFLLGVLLHPAPRSLPIVHRITAVLCASLGSAAFAGILPGDTVFLGLLSAHPALVLARAVGAVLLGVALWRRRPPFLRDALRVCAAGAAAISLAVLLVPLGGSSHPLPITEAGIAAAAAAVAGTAAAMLRGAADSRA